MENDTGPTNDVAKVLTFPRKAPKAPVAPVLDGQLDERVLFTMGRGHPLTKEDVCKIIRDSRLTTFHIQVSYRPLTMDDLVEHMLLFRETVALVGHEYQLELHGFMQRIMHNLTIMLEIQKSKYLFGLSYFHTPFGASITISSYTDSVSEDNLMYTDTFHSNCDLDFTET